MSGTAMANTADSRSEGLQPAIITDNEIAQLLGHVVDAADVQSVIRFFVVFSRFDYALKDAGFVRDRGDGGAAPDYTCYKHKIRPYYWACETNVLRGAATYILRNRPQRQLVDLSVPTSPRLHWSRPSSISRSADVTTRGMSDSLFDAVTTIRNNLFHGGKASPASVEDRERNDMLLGCAIIVLGA